MSSKLTYTSGHLDYETVRLSGVRSPQVSVRLAGRGHLLDTPEQSRDGAAFRRADARLPVPRVWTPVHGEL